MGKFDGILIGSDWDGTLFYDGKLNEKDISAIRYFCDNGGYFTLSSGRALPFMRDFFDKIMPNTYAITLNGAVIVHPQTNEILYSGFLKGRTAEVIDLLFRDNDFFVELYVYFENEMCSEPLTKDDYIKRRQEFIDRQIRKVLLISDDKNKVVKSKELLSRFSYNEFLFVSSWETSLEILDVESAKGYAMRRLKDKLGARLAVAVGDYENDMQMLQMADLSYAVANANEAAKKSADRITIHAKDGAIAQIISDLECEFANK